MKKSLLASTAEFLLVLGIIALGGLGASVLMGQTTDGDKLVTSLPYETTGQKHWFATPTGTGDCTTWNHACTFRTAVSKCTSAVHDAIYLGEGAHDTDNGVDANGTTITVDGVTIVGMGSPWAANARLVNGYATAATVLKVTGNGFNIRTVDFDNGDQTDENVVFLHINGSDQGNISDCRFTQSATATSGTGVLFDGNSQDYHLGELIFQDIETVAIKTDGASCLHSTHVHVLNGGVGINLAGASDSDMCFKDLDAQELTTAISITGASVDDIIFSKVTLINNTTNIASGGTYGGVSFHEINIAHSAAAIYPAAAGTTVSTGDGSWVWTAAPTTIIPASTITKPFNLFNVNVQETSDAQTYKLEVLYGQATANISLGIWEFTVGKDETINVKLDGALIPANSIVGVKAMSSTTGIDTLTITMSYIPF